MVNCPCPEQGRNPNSQLLSAIYAPILPTEPKDNDQTIRRVHVNELNVIKWGFMGRVEANIAL